MSGLAGCMLLDHFALREEENLVLLSLWPIKACYLTEHFTTFEPQNPSIVEFYVAQKR